MLAFASLRQICRGKMAWTILGVGICVTPVGASAMPIIAFGDSLSDTGNVFIATNGAVPPSTFYSNGRFANGAIWLDRLGAALGGNTDPALGGGGNFAFGSARVATSRFAPSLRAQANAFLSEAPASGADPGALYVVFGGSNDIRDAIGSADPIGTVTTAAAQLVGIIDDLAEAGAVDIVVPTLADVGRTPEARQAGETVAGLASVLTRIFNQSLASDLAGDNALRDINLIRPDFFGLAESITASPASFGLTNVTDPCLPASPFSVPSGVTACSNPDQFLFWDLLHPTAAAHALIADAALDAINATLDPTSVPEPTPLALFAPLLLFALLKLGPKVRPSGSPNRHQSSSA
jgi:phospholipase/lecithinase/hemolysin